MTSWNGALSALPGHRYALYEFCHDGVHVSLHELDFYSFCVADGSLSLSFASPYHIYKYNFCMDGAFHLFDVENPQCILSGDVLEMTVNRQGEVSFASTYVELQFKAFSISVSVVEKSRHG
ncbi:hypothetical protein [Dermacoccus barathri]|uniref:Uncharacterized protein n=1 Tax=Dermacoccus barathri TaxID=322601 RepID=A0ABN2B2R1_9MICO